LGHSREPMLEVRDIHVYYREVRALAGVSLSVCHGEIVAVLGANGAGKSTLLRAISGLVRPRRGEILLRGEPIHEMPPEQIVRHGVVHVPEGRRVFPLSTTWQNLMAGAFTRTDRQEIRADAEELMETFPQLHERRREAAKMLSGGEQQMLAIARGLMANPDLLLLDEPSLGLAPMLVQEIFRIIRDLRDRDVSILLVEQNAVQSLRIADRAYVLVTGDVALEGSSEELLDNEQVRKLYLGEE
jgi:branched-chain amino acid transport system ATP-binding protein